MEKGSSFVPLSVLQAVLIVLVVGFSLQQALDGAAVVDEGKSLLNVARLEMFVDDLPDMPTIPGFGFADGRLVPGNLTIGMYDKFWKFHRDLPPTRVFAYGVSKAEATIPGPTIEAIQGIPTFVTWTNHLPSRHILPWDPTLLSHNSSDVPGVRTVVHLHGGVQPPASDGSSLAWFTAGFRSVGPAFAGPNSFYPNLQPPGNLWYHDHAMGLTRVNLLAGLVGAYVLRSRTVEYPLRLPEGPEFDRHLVLFDRAFRADGSLYMNATGDNCTVHPQWQPEYFGDAIIVNGKAWPRLYVRRRRYRFRIINASNARFFRLYFKDDPHLQFIHIGSDSNYLERPVRSKQFLLSPSEIADVVVDFADSRADAVILANDAEYPFPSGDPTNEANGNVMKFVIERRAEREPDPARVPKRLLQFPAAAMHRAKVERHIVMYEYTDDNDDPTKLLLNALPFEAPATEIAEEGSVEIWNVINLTDDEHPIHIHLATFKVLEQRGLVDVEEFKECMEEKNDAVACHLEEHAKGRTYDVPPYERGWKNVFKIHSGNVTRMLVRFAPLQGGPYAFDPTAEPGYVYHCHILDHEDNAMMRPLKIVSRR